MPVENPKRAVFFNLLEQSELAAFWSSMDGIVLTNHAPAIAQATIDAIKAGLSERAILTAARIGEQLGDPDLNRPDPPEPENPWHDPVYREAVQAEIEERHMRRLRGEE